MEESCKMRESLASYDEEIFPQISLCPVKLPSSCFGLQLIQNAKTTSSEIFNLLLCRILPVFFVERTIFSPIPDCDHRLQEGRFKNACILRKTEEEETFGTGKFCKYNRLFRFFANISWTFIRKFEIFILKKKKLK
jgi:hypothetical protein